MNKKYIIYAPGYSGSNGIRALYKLHDLLRARGQESYVFCLGRQVDGYNYVDKCSRDMRENDIVIYPEVVVGNPLRFRCVVRWVLYYPGVLGGTPAYHPSETVFTWARQYCDAPVLSVPSIDTSLFFDPGLPKTQDCYFVHKGGKWRDLEEVDGLMEINMDFPKTREQLAEILKTTGTLYSFDPHSALNDEAKVCGANVRLVTPDGHVGFEREDEDPDLFGRQLDFFIEATQGLAPASVMEKSPLPERLKMSLRVLRAILYRKWHIKNQK